VHFQLAPKVLFIKLPQTIKSTAQIKYEVQHNCIVEQHQNGEIIAAFEVKDGCGAAPFRPLSVVNFLNKDNSISHAIFKPYISNDNQHHSYVSLEWVAYQVKISTL